MRITKKQFARISNIFDNIGSVIFGVAGLSPIIAQLSQNVDRVHIQIVLLGVVGAIECWLISVLLADKS